MKKILIGLIEHLGDIVACEPVARYLKIQYPESKISWVVSENYRELIDANPNIDETIIVDCLTDWIKLANHGKYDKIIDLHVNYRICEHCKIPLVKTTGNPFVNAFEWFDYGSLLEAFSFGAGLPKLSEQPLVYIQNNHITKVDNLGLGENYIVIHRESNNDEKDWSDIMWKALISWIIDALNIMIVEVGAGNINKLDIKSSYRGNYVNLINQTSILETAEIIKRSRMFIGIDSGPAHLANATFTPGVILLGRLGYFKTYNPFSGYYSSDRESVRIVRNIAGPARDVSLSEVIDAVKYVLSNIVDKQENESDASNINSYRKQILSYTTTQFNKYHDNNDNVDKKFPLVLSFYLPQFHPIPENDKAFGVSFTEWTNVKKAEPLFEGHYQPKLSRELGYYDLRSIEVMFEQVRLAKKYGISGFCFYYYYFNGKKLLYNPIDNFIKSEIDFPFCFLWANENWTKRWDGGDNEIIIEQNHSIEDSIRFIRELIPVFKDERYIKINGKPLLGVYKHSLIPDIRNITDIWREEIKKNGFNGIYLIMVDDWNYPYFSHPREFGFDASYEIPSNIVTEEVILEKDKLPFYDKDKFNGRIVDYNEFAKFHISRSFPEYKLFKTVMLPWDNTARYKYNAMVHINADNDAYKSWLTHAYIDTYRRYNGDERILFIHSWNEWCEGTYLEPDLKYGRRYLEQTAEAIKNARRIIELSANSENNLNELSSINKIINDKDEMIFRLNKLLIEKEKKIREINSSNNTFKTLFIFSTLLFIIKHPKDVLKKIPKAWRIFRNNDIGVFLMKTKNYINSKF